MLSEGKNLWTWDIKTLFIKEGLFTVIKWYFIIFFKIFPSSHLGLGFSNSLMVMSGTYHIHFNQWDKAIISLIKGDELSFIICLTFLLLIVSFYLFFYILYYHMMICLSSSPRLTIEVVILINVWIFILFWYGFDYTEKINDFVSI